MAIKDDAHHELLAQVAAMYYEKDMTQNAIANELELSRVKVYRLLKEAKEENVVQIIIHYPLKRDGELEAALCKAFGLRDALVLRNGSQAYHVALERLGQLAARYLEGVLADGDTTMAICLGRSTYEVTQAIRPDVGVRVRVAQAVGSMTHAMRELDSGALARQLAQKLDGEVLYIAAPMVADTVEAAALFRSQRDIQSTLDSARYAEVALLGIGNLDPATSGFVRGGFMTEDEIAQLKDDGAVGDVGGQIFTLEGKLHPCSFNQRVIGLTLDELRNIPFSIAVAMGLPKAEAILGGLRTGALSVLATDDVTAARVLKLNESI